MAIERVGTPLLNTSDLTKDVLMRLCNAVGPNQLQRARVPFDRWDREYGVTSLISTEFYDFVAEDRRIFLYCREVYGIVEGVIEKLRGDATAKRLLIAGNRCAGKSFALLYLLLRRIVENLPTIFVRKGTYALEVYYISNRRVRVMHEGLGPWISGREDCIALYNGTGPIPHLAEENSCLTVQTSRPFTNYKLLCNYAFFMEDWSWKEVYCAAYTMGLPLRQIIRANWLFHRFGRGIDMAVQFMDFPDDRLALACKEMDNYLCRDINLLFAGKPLAEMARNGYYFPIATIVFWTAATLVNAKDLDERGFSEIASYRFGSPYILKRVVQTYFILQRQRYLLHPWSNCKEERAEVIRAMQRTKFANGGHFGISLGEDLKVLTLYPSSILLQSIGQLTEGLSGKRHSKYYDRVILFDPSYDACIASPIGVVLRSQPLRRGGSLWIIVFSSVNSRTYLYREELQAIWHALPERYRKKRPMLALASVYESGVHGRNLPEAKLTNRPLSSTDVSKVDPEWPHPAFTKSIIPIKLEELLR